jgi:mitofusin
LWDFVDFSTLLQRQEKFAGTGMALTVAGAVVPRMIGMGNWMDQALFTTRVLSNENLRQLIVPGIVIAGKSNSQATLSSMTKLTLIHSHCWSCVRCAADSQLSST